MTDEQNRVQRFALTDHYGQFSFKNIPRQIVKLKLEKFGFTSPAFSIDLTQQQYIEFILKENNIIIEIEKLSVDNHSCLHVFPNPTNSYLWMSFDSPHTLGEIIIELYNMSGKKMIHQQFYHNDNDIYLVPINDLPAGAYMISVRSSQFTAKRVILKQ